MINEDYVLDRLLECLGTCDYQVSRAFENEYDFHESYHEARVWLVHYEALCTNSHRVNYIKTRLDNLDIDFLTHKGWEQPTDSEGAS